MNDSIQGINKDRILVRLEGALSQKIRSYAKEETRSLNSFIVNALKTYITWKQG